MFAHGSRMFAAAVGGGEAKARPYSDFARMGGAFAAGI